MSARLSILSLQAVLLTAITAVADSPKPEELRGHSALVYGVAFSPDGKLLATAGFDGAVKLWDFAARKEGRALKANDQPVYCAVFSPDGATLATCGADSLIRLWN